MKRLNCISCIILTIGLLNIRAMGAEESGAGNLLRDPEFATLGQADAAWKLQGKPDDATAEATTVDGKHAAVITVTKSQSKGQGWRVQLMQSKIGLTKDTKYKLEFSAKVEGEHSINYFIQRGEKPYAMLGCNGSAKLTSEWKPISVVFACTEDVSNAKLGIAVGEAMGKVTISEISLTKVDK